MFLCFIGLTLVAKSAFTIELGCMGMLLIAGLIEGFISSSLIAFGARVVFLSFSILLWAFYFSFIKVPGNLLKVVK